MLRTIALGLALALTLGAWGCGRKSPPRLPEGEKLKVQQEGGLDKLSVYSPYEEEIEQQAGTGVIEDIGVQDVSEAKDFDIPDLPRKRPRKDTWRRLDRTTEAEQAEKRKGIRGAVERAGEGFERVLQQEQELPASESDAGSADEGGLLPSPGGPTEGGF